MKSPIHAPAFEIQFQEILSNQFIVPGQVQLFKVCTIYDERYGMVPISKELLLKFKENFDNNVRKIDLAVDYKHESEDVAAGWIKQIDLMNDGNELWATVEWTPNGRQKLAEKEFRYLSPDFHMDYQDNETLQKHGPTLLGAGLTNRPVIKGMTPAIELSEKSVKEIEELMLQDEDLQACVSSMIPDLLNQGHDRDQAIAIAYSKCGENQMGEKKMGEIETLKAENVKLSEQLGEMQKKYEELPMSPEAMMEKLKEMQALIDSLQAEKESFLAEKEKMMQDKKMAEMTSKFDLLLSEGKAVEAQREAFMAGDAMTFAELAQPLNLGKSGTESAPAQKNESKDYATAIMELAEKKLSEKVAKDLPHAISLVLSENKELRSKYEAE